MINTLIVENEKPAIKIITEMLQQNFSEINIIAVCENLHNAVEQIKKLNPELIFLDVELQKPHTGFDVLNQTVGLKYKVIFTTSHSKYARQAFKHNALDFLDKPYDLADLKTAIEKYQQNLILDTNSIRLESLLKNQQQSNINKKKVSINIKGGFKNFTVEDIIFCYPIDGNSVIQLVEKKHHVTSETLDSIEDRFSDLGFYRSHKSALINSWHVVEWKDVREAAEVTLTEGYVAEVSKRNKAELKKLLYG